jgi:hypothetical protein
MSPFRKKMCPVVKYVFSEFVGSPTDCTQKRHRCSNPEDVQALGFEAEIDPETQKLIKIDLGEGRLEQLKCEIIGKSNDVFLLRLLHQT